MFCKVIFCQNGCLKSDLRKTDFLKSYRMFILGTAGTAKERASNNSREEKSAS
jgi:hypothetical protein